VDPLPRIVDSHTHYIEPPRADRPYVNASAMHPVSFDEIAAQAQAAGIDRVVQVTASTMGDDNRYSFEGFTARPDKVLGVVGRFDPLAPDVFERLERYLEQPGALGVRLTLFHAWSEGWLRERALDDFLHAAGEFDMPVCIHAPGQTAELLATVKRHPAVRFIVDHMNIRHEPGMTADQAFGQWRELLTLAAHPGVWTKVSYFPEAAMGSEKYPYPSARRRFRELYEHAGADRLIWGSNYPVVTRACGWREALDFVRVECDFLAPADRDAILGGNFIRDFA
jgi:predicted TIM-barrel fold metal-dependent hydrolase